MSSSANSIPGCLAVRLMSFVFAGIIAFLTGCAADGGALRGDALSESGAGRNADELLVVDCLLPGQIRKLGTAMTYLSARRAIKTSAQDCEIRGGEYTAYDRASYATALKVWLPLAQEGDKSAQTYVGEIYEKGLGIAPDYQAAAIWYRKAAEQGYSRAQINLGYLYEKGLGVARDPATALNWYRRASGLSEAIVLESDAAAKAREVTQLRAEVQTRRQSEASLRHELDATRRQLERAQKELQRRRGEAAAVQQRLETARAELEKRKQQAEARGDMAVVQRTDQQIRAREEELARSREQMARIEAQANQYREQLAKLESQQGAQQGEVLALRKEVEQHRTESASMHQQLEQARSQLAQAQQDLQRQQAEAAAQAEKLAKLKPEIESQRQQAQAAGDQQAMKRLEAQVKERERELERSRERVARMAAAADRYRQQLAKIESQQGEVLALRKEVEQRRTESASMRQQLAQAQQDLQRQQAEAAAQAEKLAKLKPEIESQRQQAQAAGDTELVKKIEAQLKSREEELARSREQIARLNGEVSKYREQVTQSEKSPAKGTEPAQVAQGGPVIEIIDPVLRATRGIPEIKTRSGIQRLVVGRVTAPAGLLAFTVNERPQELDSNGLFRTQFSIAGSNTTVQLVAIDKQGRRSEAEFMFVPERATAGNGGKAASAAPAGPGFIPPVDFGKYYALVIGNNDYIKVPKLDTAANDARAVSELLSKRYGFQVTTLVNATRYQVLSALNKYREKLTDKDNLLIYYAGHGELDKVNQRGYWLPVDAEPDSNANWISTFDITDLLNAMTAKQILVIADSCYSGALTRSSLGRLEAGTSDEAKLNWYKVMSTKRSRTVLTAGGLAPVMDAGGGDHSVFAKALLDVLAANNSVMEGERLYREVSARVAYAAAAVEVEQLPEYAPIRYAGHETGDFFFVPAGQSKGT